MLKLKDAGDKSKYFITLVKSDNRRDVQKMLNYYKKRFDGHRVTEILSTSGKTSTPFLMLMIDLSPYI